MVEDGIAQRRGGDGGLTNALQAEAAEGASSTWASHREGRHASQSGVHALRALAIEAGDTGDKSEDDTIVRDESSSSVNGSSGS